MKMTDAADYYSIILNIGAQKRYCIWFMHEGSENPNDGLITESGRVVTFSSTQALRDYAAAAGLDVDSDEIAREASDDEIDYDIDAIQAWLEDQRHINSNRFETFRAGRKKTIDCSELLNFWNLAGDVTGSLDIGFLGNRRTKHIDKIYDKLFYGCNLAPVTPEGRDYTPIWTRKERRIIVQIIEDGLKILYSVIE